MYNLDGDLDEPKAQGSNVDVYVKTSYIFKHVDSSACGYGIAYVGTLKSYS